MLVAFLINLSSIFDVITVDKVKYALATSPVMKFSPKMIPKLGKIFTAYNIIKKVNLSIVFFRGLSSMHDGFNLYVLFAPGYAHRLA